MTDNTVEAIQAHLQGYGIILYPGSPDEPPDIITDLSMQFLLPRKFPFANPNGPVFEYKRNAPLYIWELVNADDSGADHCSDNKETEAGA